MIPIPSQRSERKWLRRTVMPMDESTSGDTWHRAWPTTPSEFAALVEEYADRLVRYAYRRVGNVQDAEDIVQNVLAKAFATDRHDQVTSVGPYLYRAVGNACTDFLRRRTRSPVVCGEVGFDQLTTTGHGPLEAAEAAEEAGRAEALLRRLPPEQAEAIRLRRLRRPSTRPDRRCPGLPDQHRQLPAALRLPKTARRGRHRKEQAMNCLEFRGWLDDFLIRDFSDDLPADVAFHLDECAECAREHALALETIEAITPTVCVGASTRLKERILSSIPATSINGASSKLPEDARADRARTSVARPEQSERMIVSRRRLRYRETGRRSGRRAVAGFDPLPLRCASAAVVEWPRIQSPGRSLGRRSPVLPGRWRCQHDERDRRRAGR